MIATLRDAWRTVVPDMNDRHGPLPPLLVLLTVVTGLVDAFSYLLLGHVFVANMTGNVVFVGFALAGVSGFDRCRHRGGRGRVRRRSVRRWPHRQFVPIAPGPPAACALL